MVVIAIISLLVSILLPSLNKAKELARSAACMSNLRTLSLATAMFTPQPDTDMTLAEARAAWPAKVLWLNFPSSVHLRSDEEVRRVTVELFDELDDTAGVIMGITEDMPPDRWERSCLAIMEGLEQHARARPGVYASAAQSAG